MIKELLLVGAGSAIGGILRFLAGRIASQAAAYSFPLATFAVNISGSFLIGYLYAVYLRSGNLSASTLLLLTTGFCGGFTTFSAFTYENLMLLKNGQHALAAAYIAGSVVLGMISVYAGYALGK